MLTPREHRLRLMSSPLVPYMHRDMGAVNAYYNGLKHGVEGKVTTGICTLEEGTPEYKAWMLGYEDGEKLQEVTDG